MVRQRRVSKMSEDGFSLCQSRGSAEGRGKFEVRDKYCVDRKVRDCDKGEVRDKDEVVKYMLNPPGYLQRMERPESFQGKALSFGVLDWERLERWKQASEGTSGTFFSDASSSRGVVTASEEETPTTSLSRSSSVSANSHCSGASSSHKAERFRGYESACRGKLEEKKRAPWNADSFDRGYSDLSARFVKRLELDRRAGVRNVSPSTRYQSVSLRSREYENAVDAGTKKRTEGKVKANLDKKMIDRSLTLRAASVNSSKEDVCSSVQQRMSFRTNERTTNGTPELDLSHQPRHRKPKNIVLLRPNKYALNSRVEKHQASPDKNLVEEMQSNVSSTEFLLREDYSSELRSRIPHSCPLLFSHQTNPESETTSELLSEAPKTVKCLDNRHDVEGECSKPIDLEERNQHSVGNPCVLDREMPKLAPEKGRHASPNRRFSFSFSQMGRSFSFRESSSVPASSSPPHVSAKSGPLTSDGSVYSRQNGHIRTRSSPLRRMIDPLLKPKTENRVSTQEATESSNPRPTVTRSPETEKKQESSTVRALLQFTERKGIHLFQFVVDNNNNNVLAATMKSSDSSTRFYTFYSVKEVKKKSGGWLGQGNKERSHGFAYRIIGHVRTLTSFTSDLTTQKYESILFDAETNPGDQLMANAELAAVVEETHCTTDPSDCRVSEANEERVSTAIILPGGVHTLPRDGDALLPLIERWRSGGTCDCGGWDIGCKLRVLSDRRSHHFSNKTSKPHPNNASSLQFFDQESDQPAISLVKHEDGLHSVEFDSSITLLQAFFVSLTVSSRQNRCLEPPLVTGDGHLKSKPPVKYASKPPVSPVGRV